MTQPLPTVAGYATPALQGPPCFGLSPTTPAERVSHSSSTTCPLRGHNLTRGNGRGLHRFEECLEVFSRSEIDFNILRSLLYFTYQPGSNLTGRGALDGFAQPPIRRPPEISAQLTSSSAIVVTQLPESYQSHARFFHHPNPSFSCQQGHGGLEQSTDDQGPWPFFAHHHNCPHRPRRLGLPDHRLWCQTRWGN